MSEPKETAMSTMRMTLEQLKAMNNEQLFHVWIHAHFPFEYVPKCGGGCLTMHSASRCDSHPALVEQVRRMGFIEASLSKESFIPVLRANLEELYALRLFYDSLYPQPAPEPTLCESMGRLNAVLEDALSRLGDTPPTPAEERMEEAYLNRRSGA